MQLAGVSNNIKVCYIMRKEKQAYVRYVQRKMAEKTDYL